MKIRSKTVGPFSSLGAILVVALLSCSSTFARVLLVDDDKVECPNATYHKIQQAVNAAAPRDVIQVCPGTYNEQVVISKRLTLLGITRNEKDAVVVQPSNMKTNTTGLSVNFLGGPVDVATAILVKNTSDVVIRNIVVDGTNNGIGACEPLLFGIYYRNASGWIDSSTVRNIRLGPGFENCPNGLGIYTDSDTHGRSSLTVTKSSVHDCQLNGITGVEPATNLRVLGNTVTNLSSEQPGFAHPGIALGWDARGSIEGNSVTNFSFPTCNSVSDCDFSSTGILVFFTTANIRIAGNVVGKTNTGIFVLSPNVSVLNNEVFDTDVFDGIALIGDNNIVRDNVVTNSDESAVFIQGANNLTLNNTINDASVGLLVTAGNHFSGNRFLNTPVITELFVPQASAATSRSSLTPPLVRLRTSPNN